MTSRPTRTVLLRGGTVHSPADPFATAMLVENDTVAWVGADSAVAGQDNAVDEVVELDGALVTPAFVDAHVHTTATGQALTGLDLTGCPSLARALDQVATHADTLSAGVLFGHGWDDTHWPEGRPPSPAELDRATGGLPVYLSRTDAHSAVCSTSLLAALPGIEVTPGYQPDGPLTGAAHHLASRHVHQAVPPTQHQDMRRAALRHAASLGIGSLHECAGPEMGGTADLTALLELSEAGGMPRVFGYWGEHGAVERAQELGALGAGGDLFVDGSLGSRTASLRTPYADASDASRTGAGHTGHAQLDAASVAEHVELCTRAGTQAGFHAIGDAALDSLVAGFRQAADRVGYQQVRALRHRVEHAELLDSAHVDAFVQLGLIASVQPAFDAAWGGQDGMYARRLGSDRAAALNPFSTLARAGVPLAFGSDAPVTPLDPWGAVRAAAFHHTEQHRISVRAAFAAHTRGGWRAAGRDDAGVLVPGAPADYAVWSAGELVVQVPDSRIAGWSTDPRSGTPGLPDLSPGASLPECLRTVVRGETVYRA